MHRSITLEERTKAYLEYPLQVWIHRPGSRLNSRHEQSGIVRQLLKLALFAANISATEAILALPGIKLIQSVRAQFGIGISITHCPEMVAVAIGAGKLGLDCEALGKKRNWQGIADQFFTESEADAIRQANPEMTERVFLQHWTLKEAFIKANENSIFGAMNRLVISSSTGVQLEGRGQEHWQVWYAAIGKCILGVCYQDESIASSPLLECTDLSNGSFTPRQDTIAINFMSTS